LALTCAQGGEPKYPGGPAHYAYIFKGRPDLLYYNTDLAVLDAFARERRGLDKPRGHEDRWA
jgi:hypothetical protein